MGNNDNQSAEERGGIRQAWLATCGIFRGSGRILREHSVLVLLGAAGILFLAGYLFPNDPLILTAFQYEAGPEFREFSRILSDSGKFEFIPLLLPLSLFLSGLILRNPKLRKVAGVVLLAGIVAGLSVNVLRPAFGRARPGSGMANGFYGPSMEHRFNSFPSGHTTTAWATAVSASMTVPALSVPAIAWATGVSMSRMYQNSHYLSDVLAGTALGSFIGWLLVAGMRRDEHERSLRARRRFEEAEPVNETPEAE